MKESGSIFERIKLALNAKNDTEIANALGIKQQSVTSARKRDKVPPGWITKIAIDRGVSSDWLLFGTGPKNRNLEIKPLNKGGLRALFEADSDFPPNEELIETDDELWRFYRKFVHAFLEKIFNEISYKPAAIIKNKLASLISDEIAFKLRPRIINYLEMTKKMEAIGAKDKPWQPHLDESDDL